jgi:GNAT superfamily N-acetyltransferase
MGNSGLITVRLATLDDAAAITAIHKSHIGTWERMAADGSMVAVPYEDLSIYERWQHGGPWLSVESCAIHLNRLLAGSGIPLVAEADRQVLAQAEVYESFEPPPFGHNLELSVIVSHAAHTRGGLGSALVEYVVEMARILKCERVTVSNVEVPAFYEKQGFRCMCSGHGVRIPTQLGRVFYQSVELSDHNPAQVKEWYMPLGRYCSSRQEWDKLFPHEWAAGIPEMLNADTAHVKLTVSGGQNAVLYVREALESEPGDAHLACWTARPLSGNLLTVIRDWAYRNGHRALISFMLDNDLGLLGNEGAPTDYTQNFYELVL